ncbi:MAG TPA: MBL fold metallo-hydrolase, partial [Pirellulales bacterium]
PALLDATGCRVVTSAAGAKAIRRDCSGARIVTIADLEQLEQPGLKALATPGRDLTSVAYYFQAADEQVLVTGEIPLEISDAELQHLLVDGEPRGWNLAALQDSLLALERLRPKLWLAAHPFYGRNANLYDEEWGSVLSSSRRAVRQLRRVFPDNRH